jgi:hypothetical protein
MMMIQFNGKLMELERDGKVNGIILLVPEQLDLRTF